MKCPNCSKEIPDDKLFCGYCGTRLNPPEEESEMDVKTEQIDQPAQTEDTPVNASSPGIDMDAVTRIDRADTPTEVMDEVIPSAPTAENPCPQCGSQNPADARFCIKCGAVLDQAAEEKKKPPTEAAAPENTHRKKPKEKKPLEPRPVPFWTILLAGLGTGLGSAIGYLVQPNYGFDLRLLFLMLGTFSSLGIFILLSLYGWVRWWQAVVGTLVSAFLWYAIIHLGYGLLYFDWGLMSMLYEGAIPGAAGLCLGAFLFGRSRQWAKALGLGLLWLVSGVVSLFSLAYILNYGWFRVIRIGGTPVHASALVAYSLLGILLAAGLFWLLNNSLGSEQERKSPDSKRLWSSLGLTLLGWFLAEAVITALFALSDVHYIWPFAVMGLIGGVFTLLAFRQFTSISLPLSGAAVLLWTLLSMVRVWLGVEWGEQHPANMVWTLVSFFAFGLSAAGTGFLLNPRKPDWKLTGWLGLFWGTAFLLLTPVANYLIEFSGYDFDFYIADIGYTVWIWLTPLACTIAMFFSAHLLHKAPAPKSAVEPDPAQET